MYLCDDGHDEICYALHGCPLCEAMAQLADAKKEVKQLEDKVELLEQAADEVL
jgi:transcription initiation factor IIE alpha subunit